MESNGGSKRRGLISKSKLVLSFYRAGAKPASSAAAALQQPRTASKTAAKGSSSANHQYLQPTKPPTKGPTPSSSKTMVAAASSSPLGIVIVNHHQDHHQVFAQQAPKVAFVVKDRNRDSYNGKLENFYGGGAAEDEAVDAKAARYISNVQERFRLERVNSDPNINNYDAPVAAAPICI